MSYHNLCTTQQPPPGIGNLLGLGLKFCIQEKQPSKQKLEEGIQRFKRDIRLKHFFAGTIENPNYKKYKKIYIKSNFDPKTIHRDLKLENTLTNFENKLISARINIIRNSYDRTNLTTQQQNMIKTLKKDKHLILLVTDKNLGPAIMERKEYIKHILREHLHNKTYTLLQPNEYQTQMEQFMRNSTKLYEQYKHILTQEERKYLSSILFRTKQFRDAQFYGSPKVHKEKIPYIRFRPVVSQSATFGAYLSKYLDFKLQPLIYTVLSYVKNSFQVIKKLKQHGPFPPGSKILTSDAISMYTNIDPTEGIPTIRKYLKKYTPSISPQELDFIIELLTLVMNNNLFQFGNTTWRQNIGTAMGTPCACIYATLFFAYYEQTNILPKYKNNILFYVRMIDDIFIVWNDTNTNQNHPNNNNKFNQFSQDLNNQTKLKWDTELPTNQTNFLDLTINIDKNGHISTKTYQKPMNLFLYIPNNSSHPPGMTKSLIYGLLRTYYIQNTHHQDFINNAIKLYRRLLHRGHTRTNLNIMFTEAANTINNKFNHNQTPQIQINPHKNNTKTTTTNNNNVFIHLPFHPRDISRKQIRINFQQTMETASHSTCDIRSYNNTPTNAPMSITQLTIAYSKGPNLFDILCSSTLKEYSTSVSDILQQLRQN